MVSGPGYRKLIVNTASTRMTPAEKHAAIQEWIAWSSGGQVPEQAAHGVG